MRLRTPLLLLLLIFTTQVVAAPRVAVSIKPLHSLVSNVMQGVGEPELLLQGNDNPHHFSLKPSQRRSLARAELVVWVGKHMETGLTKAVEQSRGIALSLAESGLPQRWPSRPRRDHDHDHADIDPHIWLSPANALHIVKVVTDSLIMLDVANRESYQANRDRTLERIETLAAELEFEMALPNTSYIAHHDAYQYFENSFDLRSAGSIKNTDHAEAGAKQIRKLKNLVELRGVNCIIYSDPQRPAIIDSLGKTNSTRYARVPVMGNDFRPGSDLWFDLMKKVARGFRQCLQ